MTDQPTYTPEPPHTQEDIDVLVAFVQARVKPLCDAARYDSEEAKALGGLLNLTYFIKGAAQAELERGDDPAMLFHYLALVARQWDDHPDFRPAWDPYATRHGSSGSS
ncbi:hypothetical protein [Streptomyces scabiei]|uniref:hypothetical protein n=1 Tax=Streptomyces scabiei TaxID=1930 RepID=UPI0029B60703|nr:hypothetical protein [Streptomyces scabiei]MDX2800189.1 hypothetical protein [Streptomyces scabiei]MDX3126958.1 hypothetical protein [Streptomyces scabiei]